MDKQHTAPCRECPWLKSSATGWLGANNPVEFLQQSEAEIRMPCHLHVDYEREDWAAQAEIAPQCAGRAIHFANRCKSPRAPGLLRLKPNHGEVFTNPQDFIDHHSGGSGPRITIIGQAVIAKED